MAQALDCFGHLDILINSSGVAVSKPVLDQSPSDWDTVINTNLRGAFFMSQSVARHLGGDNTRHRLIDQRSSSGRNDNTGARTRQYSSEMTPQSARRPGDQRHFTAEIKHPGQSPFRPCSSANHCHC